MVEKRDIHKYNESYTGVLRRIEGLDEPNKKLLLEFGEWCLRDNQLRSALSTGRAVKYLNHMYRICKIVDKDLNDFNKDDIDCIIKHLNESGYTNNTKKDYKIILKIFFRWMYPNAERPKEYPDIIANLKSTIKQSESNTLSSGQILTEVEILKLINKTDNPFDKALVFCLYESGARISELAEFKIGQIKFEKNGDVEYAMITLFGKTGQREIPICSSVPVLRNWLNIHPDKNNNSFVFTSKTGFYCRVKKLLRELAKECDITKPINPHAFRHARATQLAKEGWSETKLCMFFGWKLGSIMPRVYIAMSGRDLVGDVLKLNGKKIEQESCETILKPLKCIKCGFNENGASQMFCKCGYPLTTEAVENLEKRRKDEMQNMIQEQVRSQIIQMIPHLPVNTPLPNLQNYLTSGAEPIIDDKCWDGKKLMKI